MPGPFAPTSFDLSALPAGVRALAERGELKRYRKGHRLIEEGQYGDTLYIVLAGELRVFAHGDDEREITFGTYGPGEYVGEMSLDGGPRSASVETLQTTDCAMVTRVTLLRHIAEHPEFALDLLAKVIRRARAATLSARELALNDVYGRLKRLLDSIAVAEPDGRRTIVEPLVHRTMATRLGCSRPMVSKLLKDLLLGGYLVSDAQGVRLARALPARW